MMFSRDVLDHGSVVCGTAPLFPQHTVTCQRIITAVFWERENMDFLKKHTSLFSGSREKNTKQALDWKSSTLSRLKASMNCQSDTVNSSGTLIVCFHHSPSFFSLSFSSSLSWTPKYSTLRCLLSNSSGSGWLRSCWNNQCVCVHGGLILCRSI